MAAVKALLRLFSYLFHAVLTLFLTAVSGLALASGVQNLQLGMLPWTGSTLIYVVFFGSLVGLLVIVLAILGRLRFLFLLWSLAVAVLMLKGYFLTGYRFVTGEAAKALYLTIAAWIAVAGAWFRVRQTAGGRTRY